MNTKLPLDFHAQGPADGKESFLGDLLGFLTVSRKWWLLPLLVLLLLLGFLLTFSGSAAAPFIYSSF